jgi:exopolyphosphatase/pppGpp-phosphohydrolase
MEGEKIDMYQVLNREIEVHKFRIENSKYPEKGNGKRLDMEIVVDGRKRVLFSGSVVLQEMIKRIPSDSLPFKTTIVKSNQRHEFT